VVGLAVGVWRRCRLSPRRRHFYAPTLPALADASLHGDAVLAWREHLRENGAAEVILDSFDSRWDHHPLLNGERARQEYVVTLDSRVGELAPRFDETHRRHLRRGEREGWEIRLLQGDEASAALEAVQYAAARRAEVRGDAFESRLPALAALKKPRSGLDASWGVETFAAWCRDMLLAAVLVGWANHRAYYILGGSTPEGYGRSASVWLHWAVMRMLAGHGCTAYNLGGTPDSAVRPESPAHGLFRFKHGFGAEIVRCRGVRWELHPTHLRAHALARWLFSRLPA